MGNNSLFTFKDMHKNCMFLLPLKNGNSQNDIINDLWYFELNHRNILGTPSYITSSKKGIHLV